MNVTVTHRGVPRKAKGFSCREVMDAGLDCTQFESLKLPYDMRRSTSYKENVAALKELSKNVAPKKPAKTPAKK